MPTYGKGRNLRYKWKHLLARRLGLTLERVHKEGRNTPIRRYRLELGAWNIEHSPLSRVNQNLGVELQTEVEHLSRTRKGLIRVLDWGCGSGLALNQLVSRIEGRRIAAYGYDNQSHRSWLRNPRVKFIQEDATQLLRYLKRNSMDLIFSHHGLYHLFKSNPAGATAYMIELAQRLRGGGMLITNFKQLSMIEPHLDSLRASLPGYRVSVIIPRLARKPVLSIVREYH